MLSQLGRFTQIFLTLCSIISVINLMQLGFKFGLHAPLQALLTFYTDAAAVISRTADPIIQFCAGVLRAWTPFSLPYNAWWAELFIPMSFYVSSNALGISVAHKRKYSAAFFVVIGTFISLVCSVIASIWPPTSATSEVPLIIGAGFVVFHLWSISWHTAVIANPRERTMTFSKFLFAYPFANCIIVAAVVFTAFQARIAGYPVPVPIQVLSMVIVMAFRDIAAGAYGATFERKPDFKWIRQFLGYSTTYQGLRALMIIIAAMATLIMSKGP